MNNSGDNESEFNCGWPEFDSAAPEDTISSNKADHPDQNQSYDGEPQQ